MQQDILISWVSSLLVLSRMDEVFDIDVSGLMERLAPKVVLRVVGLIACALCDLLALILLVLVGLLNCLISHMHIIPSLEKETMLFAIWVPTIFKEQIGYL